MTRRPSAEVVLAVLITVATAFYARAAYVPTWADRHVALAEDRLGIDVGDPSPWFSAWALGDGQAFALIAADPSGQRLAAVVGEPAYRFSRAAYGWAAWAVTLGNEEKVPQALALVGVLAVSGNLAVAVHLRRRLGPSVWFLILNPALYLGFAGDTAEPMGALVLALTLVAGSTWTAAILGVTRPSYLIALLRWRRALLAGFSAAMMLALYSLWRFGADRFIPDGGRLDFPLRAYFEVPSLAAALLAVLAVVTLIVGLLNRDGAWVVTAALVLSLGSDVVINPVNAWRAAGMLPVLWAFGPNYEPTAAADPSGEPAPALS
ncbi:MAG: hypothetical protein ACE5F5_09770 [Acidimicrobiia bacterium]